MLLILKVWMDLMRLRIKDQVIRASPWCTLWVDDYVVTGKKLQYVKRNVLFPSLVITGKMIHEAKQRARERCAVKRKWYLEVGVATVAVPYPVVWRGACGTTV